MKYRIRQDIMSDGSVAFWPEQKSGWWSPWREVEAEAGDIWLSKTLEGAKRMIAVNLGYDKEYPELPSPKVVATKFHPYP